MKLFLMFLLTLFLLVFITAILANGCFEVERDALLTFKTGLNDHGNRTSSWYGQDCCNWSGVTCDDITEHVVKLKLSNPYDNEYHSYNYSDWEHLAFSGELNPALLSLRHLTHLDLGNNNFFNLTIPKFIGSFENLVYLNLSLSGFHGVIPSELGNFSRLQFLDLSGCSFTGLVPLQLGNLSDLAYLSLAYSYPFYKPAINNLSWLFRLTNLRYLDMTEVDLNNRVNWSEIKKMHMLETLILSACSLSEIPIDLSHVNLTSLRKLDVSFNSFQEKLPNWLWNLTNLLYLDLGSNEFYGSIPIALTNLASLTYLNLGVNNFEHLVLEPISKLHNLRSLDLSFLAIGGDVVNLIKRLGYMWYNLDAVYLWGNNLSGNISSVMNHIRNLTIIHLSYNSLSGHMPTEIGTLTQLKVLDLNSNFLKGVITEAHFVNLSKLEILDLSNNMLTMKIDDKWIPPFQLHELYLQSCKLGPRFPTWLQWQRRLWLVDLSNTGICGAIPSWLWNMSLQVINLSYNNITGNLPKSFQLSNLQGLYLANNSISGQIPSFRGRMQDLNLSKNQINGSIPHDICYMTELLRLDLSNNAINGDIPVCWNNNSQLEYIDLSNNRFTGELHVSIGSLQSLTILQLDNNKLNGEIPSTLQYCKSLTFLSLARNNFSGNIPAWIGEQLQNLVILQLRWNNFSGSIPPELGNLSNLQILDISHNSLVGLIPSSVGNFSSMKNSSSSGFFWEYFFEVTLYIDINGPQVYTSSPLDFAKTILISGNNLNGPIPEEIWSLQAIINLNLSKNQFTGNMPEIIGGMQSLECLDLSFNNLSGPIPQALSNLSSLHNLNLSYNSFSGRIPSGRQLDTISVPSIYAGNSYLCGPQIDKNCSDNQASRSINFAHGNNGSEIIWFYMAVTLGFILGFWSAWAVLILRNDWKVAYFQIIDRFFDKFMCMLCLLRRGLVGDTASVRLLAMFSESDN